MTQMPDIRLRRPFRIGLPSPASPVFVQVWQLANLLLLFAIANWYLALPVTLRDILVILGAAVAFEHALIYLKKGEVRFFSYSSLITALGVIFLLRSTEIWIYILVVFIAFAQKHFLTVKGRHFLNPSNVAVVVGLALFPYQTSTSPHQWGNAWWLGVLMAALGLAITFRVNRAVIPVVFAVVYTSLNLMFINPSWLAASAMLFSGSFLLFIFFMMTDPRATPDTMLYQAVFAIWVAVATYLIELNFGYFQINMFAALFLVSLFVPLIRHFESRRQNYWPAAAMLGVLAVAVFATFASKENVRNSVEYALQHRDLEAELDPANDPVATAPAVAGAWPGLRFDERAELFETDWDAPHVVSVPYVAQAATGGFAEVTTPWAAAEPAIPRRKMGFGYIMQATLAAGDINHDGYLDVVMGHPGYALKILINDKAGNFIDASGELLGAPVSDVENAALVDFDNDGYLDLLLTLYPGSTGEKNILIGMFDREARRFDLTPLPEAERPYTIGGVSFYDLNGDRVPDIYFGNNFDWENAAVPSVLYRKIGGVANSLWLSGAEGWHKADKSEIFDFAGDEHNSMTVLLTDFNRDRRADLLSGNDMQASMTFLGGENGRMSLIDKDKLPYNAKTSMGYMSVDMNNDGQFELWENCISRTAWMSRSRFGDYRVPVNVTRAGHMVTYQDLLDVLNGNKSCDDYASATVSGLCKEMVASLISNYDKDDKWCASIANPGLRYSCETKINNPAELRRPLDASKTDVTRFPKKLPRNILLTPQDGSYVDMLNNEAKYTGWSWAAYPFDLDNNGYQDIYITNGMMITSNINRNAMLMGGERGGELYLKNRAEQYGLDFEDDGRGIIVADFDLDGDGDLLINNVYTKPHQVANGTGGRSIQFEFRSRDVNYYGIGTQVEVRTSTGTKLREVQYGGIWNSMQPPRVHVGIGDGEEIEGVTVFWPDGTVQDLGKLPENQLHVVYQ